MVRHPKAAPLFVRGNFGKQAASAGLHYGAYVTLAVLLTSLYVYGAFLKLGINKTVALACRRLISFPVCIPITVSLQR
jgi:hypothetical protein